MPLKCLNSVLLKCLFDKKSLVSSSPIPCHFCISFFLLSNLILFCIDMSKVIVLLNVEKFVDGTCGLDAKKKQRKLMSFCTTTVIAFYLLFILVRIFLFLSSLFSFSSAFFSIVLVSCFYLSRAVAEVLTISTQRYFVFLPSSMPCTIGKRVG